MWGIIPLPAPQTVRGHVHNIGALCSNVPDQRLAFVLDYRNEEKGGRVADKMGKRVADKMGGGAGDKMGGCS
jgi:hypothetical protein